MSDLRLHQSIRVDELVENGKLVIFYNFDRTYDLYFLLFHISVIITDVFDNGQEKSAKLENSKKNVKELEIPHVGVSPFHGYFYLS